MGRSQLGNKVGCWGRERIHTAPRRKHGDWFVRFGMVPATGRLNSTLSHSDLDFPATLLYQFLQLTELDRKQMAHIFADGKKPPAGDCHKNSSCNPASPHGCCRLFLDLVNTFARPLVPLPLRLRNMRGAWSKRSEKIWRKWLRLFQGPIASASKIF